MPIGTSEQGHETINFVGYEVTGQGHRIPNIDFEGLPRPPRAEVF